MTQPSPRSRDDDIRHWHRKLKTQKEIAKLVGLCQGLVSKAMRRLGLLPAKVGRPACHATAARTGRLPQHASSRTHHPTD